MKNKKGNVLMDIILIPVILILIAFSAFFATWFFDQVKDTDIFPEDPAKYNQSQEIKASIQQTVDLYPYLFVMVLISILVSLLISAYFIPSSPIFLVAGFIIIIVGVILAAQMSNAWDVVYNEVTFDSVKSEFKAVDLIMDILPLITFVFGALFLMVLYGKKGQGVRLA